MENLKPPKDGIVTAFKKQWRRPYRKQTFWIIILVIVMVLIYQWMGYGSKSRNTKPLPAVILASAKSKNVPVYFSALGSVTPTYTVTVKTQINGQLLRVLFKEGQLVKTGDLLAEIDPRPYLAELTQYEGQLKRDQALLDNARIDLKRYQTLWKQDSISEQTLATQESLVRQYEGAVKTDEGLIESTRVNLIYCNITSPINGRVGLRLVDPGNFVQTTDTTGIAVINMLDPITIIFTLAEDYIPKIMPKIYANQPLKVEAYDRQQNKLLASGSLLTIDNQINVTTGTVKLKGIFENKNNTLFPNQFVNVKLLVEILNNAIVIPTAAIQHATTGNFVYRLNNDQTVNAIPVTVGVTSGEDTVITKGLALGQSVVIEGADSLTDGVKVSVANSKKPTQLLKVATLTHRWRYYL